MLETGIQKRLQQTCHPFQFSDGDKQRSEAQGPNEQPLGKKQTGHISCEWKEGASTAQVQRVDAGENRWTLSFDVLKWK